MLGYIGEDNGPDHGGYHEEEDEALGRMDGRGTQALRFTSGEQERVGGGGRVAVVGKETPRDYFWGYVQLFLVS